MKITGMMALSNFPLWQKAFFAMYDLCDEVYVRFDGKNGDPSILKSLKNPELTKLKRVFIQDSTWHCPEWREDCLRLLDEGQHDIVVCPDEDEVFDDSIKEELNAFWMSEKLGMWFTYHPLITSDLHQINGGKPYPWEPHMKAFKWQPGLSYYPYHRNACIGKYHHPELGWNAKTKIQHYAAFTKGLEERKVYRDDLDNGAEKAVTLLGFGPSSSGDLNYEGEIWSLNNCYDPFPKNTLKRITRIFEMHTYEKRVNEVGRDGKPHIVHLDELGRLGHRIIMQKQEPTIFGSEPYPLHQVIQTTGMDWFCGTPCYMLALAIHEGYNRIVAYGLDQMDWEHTLQRECYAGWMMFARGRGARLGGKLTWLEKYKKRYGYDYGPEFDEYQESLLWSGHPMQVHYKIPSRVVDGKLFDGKR